MHNHPKSLTERSPKPITRRWAIWLLALALVLGAGFALSNATPLAAQEATPESEGYSYVVESGDSWGLVSQRTGVSVADLQAANPQAVRPSGWLVVGEEIYIPAPEAQQRDV